MRRSQADSTNRSLAAFEKLQHIRSRRFTVSCRIFPRRVPFAASRASPPAPHPRGRGMGCGDVRLLRTIGGVDFTGQERTALNKLTML